MHVDGGTVDFSHIAVRESRLCDRRAKDVSLDDVERISI
jgi:hypothetical protein